MRGFLAWLRNIGFKVDFNCLLYAPEIFSRLVRVLSLVSSCSSSIAQSLCVPGPVLSSLVFLERVGLRSRFLVDGGVSFALMAYCLEMVMVIVLGFMLLDI